MESDFSKLSFHNNNNNNSIIILIMLGEECGESKMHPEVMEGKANAN